MSKCPHEQCFVLSVVDGEMAFYVYLLLIFLIANRTNGATHWIVTEDGRIQSQLDSVFNLQRPYDLVAMLKQEDRARILEDLKQELLIKKEHIDKSEDRDTGLEQRFYRTDPDCIAAGKRLPEFDLYISTVLPLENKGIRPEEHIEFKAQPVAQPVPPICTEMTQLDFSMEAFEHLEGVKDRANLTGSPELGLKNAITHRDNVDDYGHLVYEALKKNKTSWVLYNMAAFYWRIKGHPHNAVECVRRALHYSPRNFKDVALISLANVLHRAKYSHEAAVVVQAALDVSKELNVNHFTLGNIYAVLAEYNKSVICFENTLKIQPDFEAAEKRKHAVLCHAKLEAALEDQHRSLQRTLKDLKEYQQKHEACQALQAKMQQDQASSDTKFAQRVGYEAYKIRKMASGVGEHCKMEERDGHHVLQCTWARANLNRDITDNWKQEHDMSEQTEDITPVPSEQQLPVPADLVYLEPVHPAKYTVKRVLTSEEEAELEYKRDNWPSKDECDTYVTKFPAWDEFPTTYLPPENKGFEVRLLLTEAQGLTEGMQHSLPWYPPVCNMVTIPEGSQKTYDHLEKVKNRSKHVNKVPDTAMKPILHALVDGDVTEAEIGQRILTAIKKELGPPWLLYNLAALYWRVIGNTQQAIQCLRHSLFFVPARYRDVPLVNLANVMYKLGQLDDAIILMKDAVSINDLEPEIQYFLANVLAAKGNLTGATYHYKQALLQEPDHGPAYASIRTLKCYSKYHRTAQSAAPTQTSTNQQHPQTCLHSCPSTCRNTGPSCQANVKRHVDSRLVCKNENGRENCVVEMLAPNCDQGLCTQTCSVSPLSLETCEGPSGLKCISHNSNLQAKKPYCGRITTPEQDKKCKHSGSCQKSNCQYRRIKLSEKYPGQPVADSIIYTFKSLYNKQEHLTANRKQADDIGDNKNYDAVDDDGSITEESDDHKYVTDGLEDKKEFCANNDLDCDNELSSDGSLPKCPTDIDSAENCLQPSSLELLSDTVSPGPMADPGFFDKMEAVKEYYQSKGLCSGDDCYKYFIQQPPQQRPHTKLELQDGILHQKLILVDSPDDIVVGPNDCIIYNDGRKTAGCQREEYRSFDFDGLSKMLLYDDVTSSHDNRQDSRQQQQQPSDTGKNMASARTLNVQNDDHEEEIIFEEDEESELVHFNWDEEGDNNEDLATDAKSPDTNSHIKQHKSSTKPAAFNRPDPLRHITKITNLKWPTWEECRRDFNNPDDFKTVTFSQFSSTWVSVSAKNMNVKHLINFQVNVKDILKPYCMKLSAIPAKSVLDTISSLKDISKLSYSAEDGLTNMLKMLGGESESVQAIGTKIAIALERKPKSWALANLAALFWRVVGDAEQALTCLRLGHQLAPDNAKDIALLGVANILYKASELDDALVACDMALEVDNQMVATHFTIANIYATKGDWIRARRFYESTLGLQPSFHPAKERLHYLRCYKVLSNPNLYKDISKYRSEL